MPGEDCEGSGVLGKRGGEALPSETNAGTEQLGLAVIKEKTTAPQEAERPQKRDAATLAMLNLGGGGDLYLIVLTVGDFA